MDNTLRTDLSLSSCGQADCRKFIARAQKRVAAEAAKIFEAEKQKQLFEDELAQAEKDLEGFRREAETSRPVQQLLQVIQPSQSQGESSSRIFDWVSKMVRRLKLPEPLKQRNPAHPRQLLTCS